MRKLAWVAEIDEVIKHPNADLLEICSVGGWKIVVKIGEFKVGDLAAYFSIDSWMPTELAPFLTKGAEPREFEGVKGERLRTVRLRGALSQGLLLPLSMVSTKTDFVEGDDLTELLGIKKWERPYNVDSNGVSRPNLEAKGNFPSLIHKIDQERVQNIKRELLKAIESGELFEVTEKLEGSSMTVYKINGEFGVCSRNVDLKRLEGNAFWDMAIRLRLEEKLANFDNIALQGELVGPGIQGNVYKLDKHEFALFDIFDVKEGKYFLPIERWGLGDYLGLNCVPIIKFSASLQELGITDMDTAIAYADGYSDIVDGKVKREGVVFKSNTRDFSFKCISNSYLMSEKD